MKSLFVTLLVLGSLSGAAETINDKVHSFDHQFGFLKLTNGRVAFLESSEKSKALEERSMVEGDQVMLEVDEDNRLTKIEFKGFSETEDEDKMFNVILQTAPAYEATTVANLDEATKMFERLNSNYKRVSECSDRAHVWSYDEYKKNGIKSMKVFAFFTASYINRNNFKWWFHVAPLVNVQEFAKVEQRVLDHRYTSRPSLIKEWTDMMVTSKRICKMTTKFSEYDVNPQTEDCYMMIDSMYYRIPGDLHNQELTGQYRSSFNDSEVSTSRRAAFGTSL